LQKPRGRGNRIIFLIEKHNCKDHPAENEYHGFFVPTQGSNMRRKIKELEGKLSTATQKHEETEREVSLFDELVFTTIMLTSLLIEFQSVW